MMTLSYDNDRLPKSNEKPEKHSEVTLKLRNSLTTFEVASDLHLRKQWKFYKLFYKDDKMATTTGADDIIRDFRLKI